MICPDCNGRGFLFMYACNKCEGSGKVPASAMSGREWVEACPNGESRDVNVGRSYYAIDRRCTPGKLHERHDLIDVAKPEIRTRGWNTPDGQFHRETIVVETP